MSAPAALVTGGAGFIGGHLVTQLQKEGCRVRILDDFSSGSRANLADAGGEVEVFEGDLLDPALLARACAGARWVFHLAAIASVPRCLAEPVRSHEVNLTGPLRVLEAAGAAGVERVVLASSCAIYGDAPSVRAGEPIAESCPPSPKSPYAFQKLAGEGYAATLGPRFGVETVALRYFNVFGPRQDPGSDYAAAIPLFVSKILSGGEITVDGDGQQTRDFVFVEDVARANWCAARAPRVSGGVYNVARGEEVSMVNLIDRIAEETGGEARLRWGPAREGDVRRSLGDPSRAREALGFEARVPLAEGLARTAASLAGSA